MTESQANTVEQPKVETQVENISQTSQEPETPSFVKSEENKENWKKFKQAREQDRKDREAAQKIAVEEKARADALKAAMEALLNKPQQNQLSGDVYGQPQSDDEDTRIQKKIESALEKERHKIAEERRREEQAQFPKQLAKACPDFDNVCSAENLDYLEYHYPEVAAGFKYMPEGLDKWTNVYSAVKKFVPKSDVKKEEAKVAKNASRPGSLSAPSTLQGQQAPGPKVLTEQQRADNWKRMQKEMNKLG